MTQALSQNLLPGVPLVESLLFNLSIENMDLTPLERDIAVQLNTRGYAVFDFPDADILERVEHIKAALKPEFRISFDDPAAVKNTGDARIQDAWVFNDDVRAVATNETVCALLSKLYGRKAFPFQTLNFPVGTQQDVHSDSVHFSSIPERFMCGVWLAMEDIGPEQGPLVYYPGSHKWPIVYNDMIGQVVGDGPLPHIQNPYAAVWEALIEATGTPAEHFHAKKGQGLIWAANLLHGGSRQTDVTLTRWSQVTHYYFENCTYYTPALSDPLTGNLYLREMRDIATGDIVPNIYVDRPIGDLIKSTAVRPPAAMMGAQGSPARLPEDFDPARYLRLNADVALAGADAVHHYIYHGHFEKRRYK